METNEVGVLHRPVRFGTHTPIGLILVSMNRAQKGNIWRLPMKAEDFQKVLLSWYP